MFRPLNLTSLVAWTAGSLAGNQAYYNAKRSRGPRIVRAGVPANVKQLYRKLTGLGKTAQSLTNQTSGGKWILSRGKYDLTTFVHVFAFSEWLESQRVPMAVEIRTVYEQSMAAGYIWPGDVIADTQKRFEILANSFKEIRGLITEMLSNSTPSETLRKAIFDAMKKRQATCHVDEITGKLVDSCDGRLRLVPPS